MLELVAGLQSLGVPIIVASVIAALAWLAREGFRALEKRALANAPDKADTKRGDDLFDSLLENLRDAKNRAEECDKQIAAMTRERDSWLVREAALVQQVNDKGSENKALFAIMRRDTDGFGNAGTERELTRMRAWIVAHIADADLELVAADLDLIKPIDGLKTEIKALALITEAGQKNLLDRLASNILARAPGVPRW